MAIQCHKLLVAWDGLYQLFVPFERRPCPTKHSRRKTRGRPVEGHDIEGGKLVGKARNRKVGMTVVRWW